MWHIVLATEKPTVNRIMIPIYLEGSYESAYTLLYGYRGEVISNLGEELKVNDTVVGEDAIYKALDSMRVLRPLDKLNVGVMPVQDAIDLAVFLATTQVQMERFLPGEPLCGGPIDVMVLRTSPRQEILAPGDTMVPR